MVPYYGDFAEDDTVNIPFNTFTSDDPSASCTITDLADADIKVHKDGSTDEIATDGATVAINFDGVTGNHLITIDTSVHADYATGSEYAVRMEGTTVDGATINAWVGAFSIERAGGTIALLKLIQAAVITNAAGADIAADIIAVKAETATIVADTNELQTDDIPGTLSTMDGKLDTAQADLDIITDADGVIIGAAGATAIIDEFETQSQADPTGFHVNVKEVNGTAQTANDNGADINDILADTEDIQTQIGTAGVGLTDLGGMSTTMKGQVNVECDTAFTDYDPPTKAEMDTGHGLLATEAKQDVIDGIIDAILVDTGTTIPALIAALENLSAAEINAEAVDALNVDTYAEPSSVPSATASLVDKISWICALARNKITQTATTQTLRNDADDGNIATAATSDDGTTFTRGEFS